MTNEFLDNAIAIVDRLRYLDKKQVVFGSSHHAYRFNPPLEKEQVDEFEYIHKVSLPVPYRRFITEVGNGGAGPYYGILPLELESPQLLHSFPSSNAIEFDENTPDEIWDSVIPGSIVLAEYGCEIFVLLVVRGDAAGQVWVDARHEGGVFPVANVPMTFDTWWLTEMGAYLERFEKILKLMKAAIAHEDIHSILEPSIMQLYIDETMLSIMNQNPKKTPKVYANKPWGAQCGLVEEYYSQWLQHNHSK